MEMESITASAACAGVIEPPFAKASAVGSVPDERGRKQRKAELHGRKGGGQPLDHKGAEIGDGSRIFFIGNTGSAKRFDNLDALDVFDDGAVHISSRLVVFVKVFAADLEGQPHAENRERKGHKRSEHDTPIDKAERNKAYDRQNDMPGTFGNHVRKRRF